LSIHRRSVSLSTQKVCLFVHPTSTEGLSLCPSWRACLSDARHRLRLRSEGLPHCSSTEGLSLCLGWGWKSWVGGVSDGWAGA
jgi:hypothetical protein